MKHLLALLVLAVALPRCTFAQSALAVQLEFAPGTTLPGLPVAMRVSVENRGAVAVTVASPMSVTITDDGGAPVRAAVSLPTAWAPELSRSGRYTIAPAATLECIATVDPFLTENELFLLSEFPLWKPGRWSVTTTVFTTDGASATSNAADLRIAAPAGDDALVWRSLTDDGSLSFSSQRLLERFDDVIAKYPESEYYRHVAPFARNLRERDDDRYAANMLLSVEGLTGPYVDGARVAIAQRFLDRHARQRVRDYARLMADRPSTSMSAILANALLRAAEPHP